MTQYAVYVESEDGAYQMFGPFNSRDAAEGLWSEINDADDGHHEVIATIGPLVRPRRRDVKPWLRRAVGSDA